jgi:MFS family permease
MSAWLPTYVMRQWHWTPQHTGVTMGTITAIFGSLGVVGGGWIADRMAARGHKDAYIRTALWSAVLWYPSGIAMLLVPSPDLAFLLFAPSAMFGAAAFSIGPAALMQITPQRMRGQVGAVYLFVVNLIGLGIGPTAVALCTDYIFHDDNMVGMSLLIVTCVAHLVAAVCLWYARQPFVRSIASAKAWAESNA